MHILPSLLDWIAVDCILKLHSLATIYYAIIFLLKGLTGMLESNHTLDVLEIILCFNILGVNNV